MAITVKTTIKPRDAGEFVAFSISKQLNLGKKVLFFVAGGSSISVALKVADILKNNVCKNLTITLTDERYGEVDYSDSNLFQLKEKGFILSDAKIVPILIGEDIKSTTEKFNNFLKEEFENTEYKIGLFGVGSDGHTAGILPESGAVNFTDLVYSYETPEFSRITLTPSAIWKLDEVVVWAQGEEKWNVIKDLLEKEIDVNLQPAQILKKVPLLTIFSDYVKL